jgi:DNA-binding response OmpR family regulator
VPASQESPAGPAPSVLLIEEYDALAAAIASALKKFAPKHRVRAVESLTEAEATLVESSPLLLIVDFDPPRTDIIEFLERVSAVNADARMLAIASGVPAALNAARLGPSAIQFIDKPFELAEFGAAVQALLGPWTNASSGDSRGTLRNLGAADLVPLQCLNLATAVLHLRSENDRAGEIHFLDGQITHAATGNFTGVGALHQMMGWKNPHARETERTVDGPRTIQGAWQTVLLEAFRHAVVPVSEEPPRIPPPVPTPPVKEPPKPVVKTGKKIVVIDDTEMLLIFVEDALATADPSLQIITALTGTEGVRRAETALPDLVLLDYSLPDLRGDQVCERLLQNEATAGIPVVMMSGHVSEMAATARKYRNVAATIAKPFMSEALVSLVKEMLAKGPLPPERPPSDGNGKKPGKKNGARLATPPAETPAPRPGPQATELPAAVVAAPPTPVAAPAPAPAAPTPVPATADTPPAIVAPPPIPPPAEEPAPIIVPVPIAVGAPNPPAVIPRPAPLAAANGSIVMVALGMEVLAVQFTPRFQIGAIRARPTFSTLSLSHSSAPSQNLLAGFEVGPVELDPSGRIHTLRVLPTRRPPDPVEVQTRLEIQDIALVNQNASIQVTGGRAAPMTLKLMAVFKVASVELSDRFEVAQLVLQSSGGRVRVNLDPQSRDAGAEFETVGVRLDSSRRIAEFILSAVTGPKTV